MENIRDVGINIKKIRKQKGITLQYLAENTGLSIGFLSNIERDQTSPSISTLKNICDAIGTTITEIIKPCDEIKTVIRKEEAHRFRNDKYHMMVQETIFDTPFPVLTRIDIDAEYAFDHNMYRHSYDEIGLVVSGTMDVILEGEHYLLQEGDAIRIQKHHLHCIYNESHEPCHTIWIQDRNKDNI